MEQKYRHNMAFLTRFKVDSNELRYYTSIPSPIKDWPFRQRAAYDAVVSVAKALKLHKQATGTLPSPVETCGTATKSTLEEYLKQVINSFNQIYGPSVDFSHLVPSTSLQTLTSSTQPLHILLHYLRLKVDLSQ